MRHAIFMHKLNTLSSDKLSVCADHSLKTMDVPLTSGTQSPGSISTMGVNLFVQIITTLLSYGLNKGPRLTSTLRTG